MGRVLETTSRVTTTFSYTRSHRLDRKRLDWEKKKAILAATDPKKHGGGAFRIQSSEFEEVGLSEPKSFPVPANTLVIADTVGFHRRGDAEPWSQRLSLFGQYRPYAFDFIGR